MAATFSLRAPAGVVNSSIIGLSGASYGIDSTGLVAGVSAADVGPLLAAGYIIGQPFGASAALVFPEGNLYRFVSAGQNPGIINGDNVLATYALPANAFDQAGRGVMLSAMGLFANNTNSKRVKLWIGATAPVVGAAISGGVLICDTNAYTTTGAAQFQVAAQVFKYGGGGSNTQMTFGASVVIAGAHSGSGTGASAVPQTLTQTENAAINLTITGNAVTSLTDIALNLFEVNALN